jgi:mannose-6-phosphate isomerase
VRVVRKPWGKETILIETELYCSKIITCKDNEWSSGGRWHYHERKDETFYVLDGILQLELKRRGDDEAQTRTLHKGDIARVYPRDLHRFKSKRCKFLEVSTHDDPSDTVRMEYE